MGRDRDPKYAKPYGSLNRIATLEDGVGELKEKVGHISAKVGSTGQVEPYKYIMLTDLTEEQRDIIWNHPDPLTQVTPQIYEVASTTGPGQNGTYNVYLAQKSPITRQDIQKFVSEITMSVDVNRIINKFCKDKDIPNDMILQEWEDSPILTLDI